MIMDQFQSSPAPEGECNWQPCVAVCEGRTSCFNPHPPLRASATSIQFNRHTSMAYAQFQSSPAPEGECNLVGISLHHFLPFLFQSSPAPEGECNMALPAFDVYDCSCFNPHPPLRASATWRGVGHVDSANDLVSILTRP